MSGANPKTTHSNPLSRHFQRSFPKKVLGKNTMCASHFATRASLGRARRRRSRGSGALSARAAGVLNPEAKQAAKPLISLR